MRELRLSHFAWATSSAVSLLAIFAWGQGSHWQFAHLTVYRLFPLFGLIAFSLLWSTYVAGVVWRHSRLSHRGMDCYYRYIGFVILLVVFLHPSLLIWQLWRDGLGLPPGSYESFVGRAARWAVVVSALAFLVIASYELRWWFGKKSWWRYVIGTGSLAMIGLFLHSLRLGTNLQHGWFRYVWYFYGVTLVFMLIDLHYSRFRRRKT